MSEPLREQLTLEPIADAPEVGRWLSALEDGRRDTLRELETVTPAMIDWRPDAPLNSIGTLLYHIALIEADWLNEILPYPDRDGTGALIRVDDQPLSRHLDRLGRVRSFALDELKPMSVLDFHTVRARQRYDVSPAWVVHHLLQHEAEHRSHIAWLRDSYRRG